MNFLQEHFMQMALFAGLGLAAAAGPLGCFITWRRMAYFGDALSHSALLGIAVGLITGIALPLSVVVISLLFAVVLLFLQQRKMLATDTLLGILSHTALASGMVIISLVQGIRLDVFSYLFGDILAVGPTELFWLYCGTALCLTFLIVFWKKLLLLTIHEDIARADGCRVELLQLGFMLVIAIVIALAMRMVGVLLITSMLIIPAAAARQLASTPCGMAAQAVCYGALSVVAGLCFSYHFDTPTGPTIVSAAAAFFVVASLARGVLKVGE